jgi:C4-type Zn-finger protein
MHHPAAAPTSRLPSIMMPCPVCAGRMTYHGSRAVAPDVEDTVYACKRCGTELIRTAMRQPTNANKGDAAKAA